MKKEKQYLMRRIKEIDDAIYDEEMEHDLPLPSDNELIRELNEEKHILASILSKLELLCR